MTEDDFRMLHDWGVKLLRRWKSLPCDEGCGISYGIVKGENVKTVKILGFKANVARTFWERTRGLIGTKSLAPDEGLLIERCNLIHMLFMSFPIDAYFLDKDDKVVKVIRSVKPWRPFVWGGRRAVKVLETACRSEMPPDRKEQTGVPSSCSECDDTGCRAGEPMLCTKSVIWAEAGTFPPVKTTIRGGNF